MRNAIFVDFEERNTTSVDVWVIFGSFSNKGRHDLAKPRASSIHIHTITLHIDEFELVLKIRRNPIVPQVLERTRETHSRKAATRSTSSAIMANGNPIMIQ